VLARVGVGHEPARWIALAAPAFLAAALAPAAALALAASLPTGQDCALVEIKRSLNGELP
jgi:hypothetical protein